jgi:hypothetical protein
MYTLYDHYMPEETQKALLDNYEVIIEDQRHPAMVAAKTWFRDTVCSLAEVKVVPIREAAFDVIINEGSNGTTLNSELHIDDRNSRNMNHYLAVVTDSPLATTIMITSGGTELADIGIVSDEIFMRAETGLMLKPRSLPDTKPIKWVQPNIGQLFAMGQATQVHAAAPLLYGERKYLFSYMP